MSYKLSGQDLRERDGLGTPAVVHGRRFEYISTQRNRRKADIDAVE